MTNVRSHHNRTLDSFALLALVITFLLRYAPFLASRLLFGPFLDNLYLYGPLFSEVSSLASSGTVPYYLPNIGTGFPVFDSPQFSILYPFYFFGLIVPNVSAGSRAFSFELLSTRTAPDQGTNNRTKRKVVEPKSRGETWPEMSHMPIGSKRIFDHLFSTK